MKMCTKTYPPFESIILNQSSGAQMLATPIKRSSLSDDNKNLDSIIQQNNYTNIYLKSISQKLQDIEDRITPPSTSIKKENASNTPLFIPHEIPPHLRSPLKKPMTEKIDDLLNEINKNLDLMKLESQKDMDPLKKNRTLNTIGRTKLKGKLMSILEQTNSDETDNEIHQIDNCDITSSSTDISSDNGKVKLCNCNHPDNCYCNKKLKISVLTKQEDIIMDLIDKLPDLQSRKDYLSKIKESLTQTDRFERL